MIRRRIGVLIEHPLVLGVLLSSKLKEKECPSTNEAQVSWGKLKEVMVVLQLKKQLGKKQGSENRQEN